VCNIERLAGVAKARLLGLHNGLQAQDCRRDGAERMSHAFKKQVFYPMCEVCGKAPGDPVHILSLFEQEQEARREEARQRQESETLAEIMRTPKADVSKKAGQLERESPLSFGTGANPSLFYEAMRCTFGSVPNAGSE